MRRGVMPKVARAALIEENVKDIHEADGDFLLGIRGKRSIPVEALSLSSSGMVVSGLAETTFEVAPSHRKL